MNNDEARARRERAWVVPDLRSLADYMAGQESSRTWLERECEAKVERKEQGR